MSIFNVFVRLGFRITMNQLHHTTLFAVEIEVSTSSGSQETKKLGTGTKHPIW